MAPASLAIIAALETCINASAFPHLVVTPNVGLVPAWLGWTPNQEAKAEDSCSARQFVAEPRYRFDD